MTQQTSPQKTPDYGVYTVEERKSGPSPQETETRWHQIGVAWIHGDSQGLNIKLNALPLDNKITLRRIDTNKTSSSETSGQNCS
jgi:hypothetical protein